MRSFPGKELLEGEKHRCRNKGRVVFQIIHFGGEGKKVTRRTATSASGPSSGSW